MRMCAGFIWEMASRCKQTVIGGSVALGPKLEFRQSQQLVMTPQLQQAIKLLQLSNMELAEYVAEQLEENPFLERLTDANDPVADRRQSENNADPGPHEAQADQSETPLEIGASETQSAATEAMDAQYEDLDPHSSVNDRASTDHHDPHATNEWATNRSNGALPADDRQFDATLSKDISLSEHLNEQLQITTRNQHDLFIGAEIIDQIDEAGYFRGTLADISDRLGAEPDDVDRVLTMIQSFEPSGVAARDIQECLALQLREKNRLDPAMAAFVENIELLAKGDMKGLMQVTQSNQEDVRDMIAEIRALTPKPGYAYGHETVQTVIPDIFVRKAPDGGWSVELNSETLPRVLVNQTYYVQISGEANREEDKIFLSEQMNNANWLIKSLDQRARTILKVASEIVRQQDAFFAYGIRHLRPLNLRTVADAIEMHESTVSRATANKYMATPRGLFELKYFFTASIASSSGGEAHAAETVRHMIKELISTETAQTVLSDDRIVELLKTDGIDIARRTVAKYRETLGIPSSVQRRRAFAKAAM